MHDALIPSRESPRYVPFCVHSFLFSARDAFFRMPLMVRGGCVVKPLVLSNSFWNFSCVLSKFLLHWTLCSNLSWWCCIHLPKFLSLMTVMLIEEMKKQSSGINRAPPPLPETRLALSAPCHVVRLRLAEEFVSSWPQNFETKLFTGLFAIKRHRVRPNSRASLLPELSSPITAS